MSEADTRAKLIDRYFTVSVGQKTISIVRKPPVGLTYIIEGKPKRRARGRIDYPLCIRVNISTQPRCRDIRL